MADLPQACPNNCLTHLKPLCVGSQGYPKRPRHCIMYNTIRSNNGSTKVFRLFAAPPNTHIEWTRGRALVTNRIEDEASSQPRDYSNDVEISLPNSVSSISNSSIHSIDDLGASESHKPMLQLVAAWDSLAARLPPQTGAGPDADVLVNTLKLVLANAPQDNASKALTLASKLAELAGLGIPLDASAISAGILAEAFPRGFPHGVDTLEERLGHSVVALLADLDKVKRLPSRIELYDDSAAQALRELCLAFYDVRSTVVEVISRLHHLQHSQIFFRNSSDADLQVAALEALQIYAPLGHALGMASIAAQLEDLCFQILFPASYEATTMWLKQQAETNAAALESAKAALRSALLENPKDDSFLQLARGLELYGRTKSPFSTLKKLLRLGNTSKGGRSRSEVYDLIGLRAVVLPREDLERSEAEQAAIKACYLLQSAAHCLWRPIEGRTKDYIMSPKPNGYQSLHSALVISPSITLELQVRTDSMHVQAESGEAAHAAYKGGLDAAQAVQLRQWTAALLAIPSSHSSVPTIPSSHANDNNNASTSSSEALFRSIDLNRDGKVSLEELAHAVAELQGSNHQDNNSDMHVGFYSNTLTAQALLDAVDTNSDGEVSLQEFLDFQSKVGLAQGLALATAAMDQATAAATIELIKESQKQDDSTTTTTKTTTTTTRSISNRRSASALQSWGNSSSSSSSSSGDFEGKSSKSSRTKQQNVKTTAPRASTTSTTDSENLSSAPGWSSSPKNIRDTGMGSSDYDFQNDADEIDDFDDIVDRMSSQEQQTSSTTTKSASVPSSAPSLAAKPERGGPAMPPALAGEGEGILESTSLAQAIDTKDRSSWTIDRAMHGFMRIFQRAGVAEITATWQLSMVGVGENQQTGSLTSTSAELSSSITTSPTAANTPVAVIPVDATGQPFSLSSSAPILLPRHGPCIVGAVSNKDCDIILDHPTISGRHARFEVIRQHSSGLSKCVVMDLGSTNGTWVNRAKITPFKEVPLYPGDVVCLAEPGIAFQVGVNMNNNAITTTAAAVASTNATAEETQYGPAVRAALRAAAALEAEAASRGVFAPVIALGSANVGDKARKMLTAGDYQTAYMLLLGSVMNTPHDAALWAQLAAIERQRSRRHEQNSSSGTTRVFLRAAAERFEALDDPAPRRSGLSKVFSAWAQLEYDMRNDGPARILFQKAVRIARSHPAGAASAGAAKLLFTWASREWKLGDAPLASRLCQEVLDIEPTNPYALTLLGNIESGTGDVENARKLFKQAIASDSKFVSALQSWARLEAQVGNMKAARQLFRKALKLQPTNSFVMQAWGVAEGRCGEVDTARALFARCTQIDPGCYAAWHAWGKLEEENDNTAVDSSKSTARKLYIKALEIKSKSLETLSALGRLERLAGNLATAEDYLQRALRVNSRHAPALNELAQILREKGNVAEAYRLEKKAKAVNAERRAMLMQVKRPKSKTLEDKR